MNCPHQDRTTRTSVLLLEPTPKSKFFRKLPLLGSTGCSECRAEHGFADAYFIVPWEDGQDLRGVLSAAVGRLEQTPG